MNIVRYLPKIFISPERFYAFSRWMIPVLAVTTIFSLLIGVYWGLFVVPADYDQGNVFRIMYVHVPAAWMSMFIFAVMGACFASSLIWRIRLLQWMGLSCASIGAIFTMIALITGSIWGKPTWGTWWIWDARLTSELILLFQYLGVIVLNYAILHEDTAEKVVSILSIVGLVNLPIIHYSVKWWNTLHQGASVTKIAGPSIHSSMLWPLLIMAIAFKLLFLWLLFVRLRVEILNREYNKQWMIPFLTKS